MDEVLEFIKRRFKENSHWLDGNCYYFAMILKARFPIGIIYYDVIKGHFVFRYDKHYYDWNGIVDDSESCSYIRWDDFDKYDSLLKARIIRDCVM